MKKMIMMLMAVCLVLAVLAVPVAAKPLTLAADVEADTLTPAAEAEADTLIPVGEEPVHTMEMLQVIILTSIIMWYIIDRIKPLWESLKYGKYITIALSALFAFALSFGYRLDIMAALGVVPDTGPLGTVLTALTLMGGSSAVAELIKRIKV